MANPEMSPRGEDIEESQEEKEFREVMNPEKMEISPEFFLNLLSSDKFLEALKISSQEELASGRETGFMLKVLKDKTPYIYGVVNGSEESIDVAGYGKSSTIKKIDGEERETERKAHLMSLHFHPKISGPIIPSLNDLDQLHNNFSPPIMSIGQTRENGQIDLLLVRNKKTEQSYNPEKAENFREELEKIRLELNSEDVVESQQKVQNLLDKNGFESFLISFLRREEKLELDKKSKEVILNIQEDASILKY